MHMLSGKMFQNNAEFIESVLQLKYLGPREKGE